MNVKLRSDKKEILDQDNIPFADIEQNMSELNTINKYLGGHNITIEGFKQLALGKNSISVCEIGCGGGDNLNALYEWSKKNSIQLSIVGIDIKEECIQFARTKNSFDLFTEWITSDYRLVNFTTKPDIIFSSLFCHHFSNEELLEQFKWMKENSRIGFFINDLQRNYLAYHSIRIITKLFSESYLVKNDAPLSVLRGFKKIELINICKAANTNPVTIKWKWAFRYLLMYKHDTTNNI